MASTGELAGDSSPLMAVKTITKGAAAPLTASGLLFLIGAVIHPHAPNAPNMAEVAYTQTGQAAWWPAHLLLLSSYGLFVAFLIRLTRIRDLPYSLERALRFVLPVAWFAILAMTIHLLLPLGRDSVAASHHGWAFWAKDFVESADGVWALGVAAVAWSFGRAGIVGNRLTAVLGLAGGLGFAVFSALVPLTGVLVSMSFTRSVLQIVPLFAILIAAWAVSAGFSRPR